MDYKLYTSKQISLRDKLAIERTLQSTKRTLLSYIATSLGIFLAGVTIWHLTAIFIIGLLFIVVSLGILWIGFEQKRQIEDALSHLMGD
jgi:uncharacterized membrane protein YidH (DUF202 family)